LKGLGAACLGLLLATIGLDIIYGTNRFVFGQVDLMAGLNFIPVLIGLFALPEIIAYYGSVEETREHNPLAGKSASFRDFLANLKTIIRGSVIGVVLGAIPGIGGAVIPKRAVTHPTLRNSGPASWKESRQRRAAITAPQAPP